MNRNTESHFASLPAASIGRSKFNRSFTHKLTFNAGELIPCFVDPDILPGDTVHMKQSEVVRMMTPLVPVLDNAWLDFYWFFIPNRLVWTDFKKFMGENTTAPWTQNNTYQVPQLIINNGAKNTINGVDYLTRIPETGSVIEHMGIPAIGKNEWTYASTPDKNIKISWLPTRAYCLVWNEFFRDENLQNPINVTTASGDNSLRNTKDNYYITDPDAATVSLEDRGGLPPLKVCKAHDYFTSALPGMQKGPAVSIPLSGDVGYVKLKNFSGTTTGVEGSRAWFNATYDSSGQTNTTAIGYDSGNSHLVPAESFSTNLFVDLQNATGATITQLRQAFAIQKFYERDARGGTRYIESVWSHFGVRNPDYRLQRPEYLGGWRQPININQVVQTNYENVNDGTPLGSTGAYSVTSHKDPDVFTHSFTEHGILLGCFCVRTNHTYAQGINRSWFKKNRLDFYSPEFANLSEQAILNKEIYVQGTSTDEEAFGYQEAWAEMRYMPDICTGLLSPKAENSLDYWTYTDSYSSKPTLGDKWIQETKNNIQRSLALTDYDQFIGDFYFGAVYTRPMPLYSIPGLIDHH